MCYGKKRLFVPTTHTKEYSMSQTLLEMAKDLVMAQIEAHRLTPDEMHTVLQHTYTSLRKRSGCQNITLAITYSYGVPCRHGNTGGLTPRHLGTDTPRSASLYWNA